MTRAYSINWLEPEDAAEIARLEAQNHTVEHRAGEQVIAAQLTETAEDGRNLSVGLYFGAQLVGFVLAFVARSRREVASFFDAPIPADLSPDDPVIYLADMAVLPRHRRMTSVLLHRLARAGHRRDDLRSHCVDAFSTEEYLAFWTARAQFISRVGLKLVGRYPYHDARLATTMYWLSLLQVPPVSAPCTPAAPFDALRRKENHGGGLTVGEVETGTDLSALAHPWDALLARTRHSTVWQRFCYLHSWWSRAGALSDLFIPIAVRDGVAAAIAPMRIEEARWLGRRLRRLTFLGSPPEASCVSALAAPEDGAALAALADRILTEQAPWDSIVLTKQRPDDPFVRVLETRMRAAHLPISVQPGPPLPWLSVTGSWGDYLAGRSALLRKRLAAAEHSLSGTCEVRFDTCGPAADLTKALERFMAIESNAPDDRRDLVSASSATMSFFQELAARHGESLGMQFGFLAAGPQDIAGILGFASNGSFYPVHVTWDRAFAARDAGLLVTARQLQRIFDEGACRTVVLSSPDVPARSDWATETTPTATLFCSRGTVSGWLLHATYSVGKPWLRRLIGRAAAS